MLARSPFPEKVRPPSNAPYLGEHDMETKDVPVDKASAGVKRKKTNVLLRKGIVFEKTEVDFKHTGTGTE